MRGEGMRDTMWMWRWWSIVTILGGMFAANGAAQGAADPAPKMQELIQSYAKSKALNKQFMGSVLVAQGDRVVIDQGYGSANLEWGIPNGPDTKFRLGSLTKQF